MKEAQVLINASKISRSINPTPLLEADEVGLTQVYLRRYFAALPLGSSCLPTLTLSMIGRLRLQLSMRTGKALPTTELQPADDFALLAGQSCISSWSLSRRPLFLCPVCSPQESHLILISANAIDDPAHLQRALALVTHALGPSAHSYRLRLLALLLARLLAAPGLAKAQYRALGIKSVQIDTLGHVMGNRETTFCVGQIEEEGSAVGGRVERERFYEMGEREGREMRVQALQMGAFSKVRSSFFTSLLTFDVMHRRNCREGGELMRSNVGE